MTATYRARQLARLSPPNLTHCPTTFDVSTGVIGNNRLASSGVAALPPFALEPNAGERLAFGDVTILVRASTEATGGLFSLFEEVPPMVDTPRHVHEREDEVFYVLEGEHVIEVGDEEFAVAPGGVVFAPRRVPHAQRRVAPGEGRLLVLTAPGGFEGFFRELAAAQDAGTLGPDAYAAASDRYGITWL